MNFKIATTVNGYFLRKFDRFSKNNLNNCKGHWFARVIKTR